MTGTGRADVEQAVTVAHRHEWAAALHDIQALVHDDRLAGYRYLPAIKADLLRRLDRHQEVAMAYPPGARSGGE